MTPPKDQHPRPARARPPSNIYQIVGERQVVSYTISPRWNLSALGSSRTPSAGPRRPLGLAVVGGLFFSQFLTLFITPVVYVYMDRFRAWAPARLLPQRAPLRAGEPGSRRASRLRAGRTGGPVRPSPACASLGVAPPARRLRRAGVESALAGVTAG
ncbi:MAG: efflux RND transporter permease subunit [Terriglobales bacterium]